MDLIKLELRDAFADKRELQNTNLLMDKLVTKIEQFNRVMKEQSTSLNYLDKSFKEELSAFKTSIEAKLLEQPKEETAAELNDSKLVEE